MPYNLSIPGWMSEADLAHITTLAKFVPENGAMIEVGSLYGRSTWAWAMSIPPTALVHCIDVWTNVEMPPEYRASIVGDIDGKRLLPTSVGAFLTYMQDCRNIRYTQGDSSTVLKSMKPEAYDLVFLDGMHTNPALHDDIEAALPLLRQGGILCGHDYSASWPDVMTEVTALATRLHTDIRFSQGSSIWVVEKTE